MTRHAGIMAGKSRRPVYIEKGNKVATTGSAAPSYPAGIIAGDLLVLIVQTDQNDSVSTPAGWTLRASVTSTECDLRVYTKFHTTGTSVSVSWSGDHICCQVLAFRDVNSATPVNDSRTGNHTGLGSTVNIPGVTTTVDNCLVLAMVAHDIATNSSCVSNWANASLSEGEELTDISTTAGWDGGFAVYAGYKETAGVVDTTTASLTQAKKRAYFSMALAPP
jgi:hypothetical protein